MNSETSPKVRWVAISVIIMIFVCLLLSVLAYKMLTTVGREAAGIIDQVDHEAVSEETATPYIPPAETPGDPQLSAETRRQLAKTIVPENSPIELAERLKGLKDVPSVVATSAEPIPIGATQTFWASNVDTIENFKVDARMVYATDHVYFWVEEGVNYDLDDVRALVDEFETKIYPTDRTFFGSEWRPGVDGDDHLYILFATGLGSSVAGYFSAADELSPLAHEFSNAHEMFYLSADNVALWEEFTYGVLAHEFQHMIHWAQDRNEESWLNEGFSELAAHLNGYDVGGWDYAYSSEPDLPLTYWPTNGGPHYGQSFLFLAYFLDRFGPQATQAVVADPANGLDSIDETLANLDLTDAASGAPVVTDDVFRDWAVALLLGDASLDEGRYAYASYTPPVVGLSDTIRECPGKSTERSVNQFGVDYIRITCPGEYTLRFEGRSEVPVLPAEPHSGNFAFWSNRGDESDMTLTRAFDLTAVNGAAELSYWVWYDIEEGWDYLYLEASTDGGETWQILETPSGTDEDLSGNSYGWAYTGMSGGRSSAQWIEESVDLSAYAGENVLLRFEYITDAAVNGDGLLLDDLSLDAIGYQEDFEEGDGGWEAAGFVRLYNRLPQTYRVVLVEEGAQTTVRDIPLDEDNTAQVPLAIGEGVDHVTVIVIGTTRHTWQPAPYTLEVQSP